MNDRKHKLNVNHRKRTSIDEKSKLTTEKMIQVNQVTNNQDEKEKIENEPG